MSSHAIRQRLLVLGGNGMLGHALLREAPAVFEVETTVRSAAPDRLAPAVPGSVRIHTGVDALEAGSWTAALEAADPDVVVNCIGAVKQRAEGRDPEAAIALNSLFPHRLARVCAERGCRLIHISTDCVFSGTAGGYSESDPPDPADVYGRSKLLGEPEGAHVLTLRTSFIGRELDGGESGLLEWLLAQRGSVKGFRRAIFSGITATELARVICACGARAEPLSGLFHAGGEPISKYELLVAIKDALDLRIDIEPEDETVIDRSLDGARLRAALGWEPPPWSAMLADMERAEDPYRAATAER